MSRFNRTVLLICFSLFALPLSHQASTDSRTLAERVASLEDFRVQQRDWNNLTDRRISTDLTTSQGAQDAKLDALEERLSAVSARQMVVYAFGGLGSLLFVVGAPIAWGAYSANHRQIVRYQRKLERIYRMAGYEAPEEQDEESDS